MATEVKNGAEKNGAAATTVAFSAFKLQLQVLAPKAADAVQFYKSAFGAEEVSRDMHPKRKAEQDSPLVLSVDLKVGGFVFSVADLTGDSEVKNEGAAGVVFCLETDNLDGALAAAVSAGAVAEGEVTEDEVAGRVGKLKDPFGYTWVISSPAAKKPADVAA
ncbi:hypothetical protein SOVF_069060 [Spinacia oleracea]|uniref:Uncharacterized protein At5g48480 n=1 Tax=Spinacia oleracea TaxID=3562 RepID=A0A9R0K5C8_SPIOL|nr:uncharacterized protein At5g48480 [Spinacia oleracea]KNA18622.1 hypothetical protein SOVF_069060 [Spinacia oleracea]